jgi:pyrimidine operon attenuation protein/uracil phosphoribosyltransferase
MIQLLQHQQVLRKINRLAIQILEQHHQAPEIVLAGINHNGYQFARYLSTALLQYAPQPHPRLVHINLHSAEPTQQPITLSVPASQLTGRPVIVIDDVANTGRTLYYAMQPILQVVPSSVQVAVLVERTHQQFPVQINFVGVQLATTLTEHVEVRLSDPDNLSVFLH